MSDRLPPLDPIVGAADFWPPVSAVFMCDQCGSVACTVTLVPPMASDPLAPPSGTPGAIPGNDRLFAEHVRVAVDGPVQLTHTLFAGAGSLVQPLDAALRAGDPDALYAVNSEFAPFRCPACAKSYCKKCWRTWVTFADDHPAWYEDTKGMCPSGHTRIMDD